MLPPLFHTFSHFILQKFCCPIYSIKRKYILFTNYKNGGTNFFFTFNSNWQLFNDMRKILCPTIIFRYSVWRRASFIAFCWNNFCKHAFCSVDLIHSSILLCTIELLSYDVAKCKFWSTINIGERADFGNYNAIKFHNQLMRKRT